MQHITKHQQRGNGEMLHKIYKKKFNVNSISLQNAKSVREGSYVIKKVIV